LTLSHVCFRCSVLHNPHLGLSRTLHKLYNLAKGMADCVVPQEYGTTVEEKRSVGLKICHSLLEKIKYDIGIARSDNDTDMRYLINMDYSFDLNINTMGRRIRTRLYFTSESHLHTVLNTLRFGHYDGCKSLLSESGLAIINATPELCYLTQIVMRVFEDSRRDINDPRRFRVEVLFSPGATATPFHMGENDRETDNSRFDTAPLQVIGREDLTCQEVEDFLGSAIMAGRGDDDEYEIASMSTAPAEPLKRLLHPKVSEGEISTKNASVGNAVPVVDSGIPSKVVLDGSGSLENGDNCKPGPEVVPPALGAGALDALALEPAVSLRSTDLPAPAEGIGAPSKGGGEIAACDQALLIPDVVAEHTPPPCTFAEGSSLGGDSSPDDRLFAPSALGDSTQPATAKGLDPSCTPAPLAPPVPSKKAAAADDDAPSSVPSSSSLAIRKYFWTSVALGSFTLGVSCLLVAMGAFEKSHRSSSRSRRYPSNVSSKWL
jgi:Histidine phosphatase superfamily (branch 2)